MGTNIAKRQRSCGKSIIRKATSCVPGFKDMEYQNRLKAMRIPSMSFRRFRDDLIEIYEYTHRLYNCPSPFVINSESKTRGHNFKITKQPCNTSLKQKFFTIRAVDSWNNLNQTIVNAKSLDSFKNLIDKEFKDLMYETNL